MKSATVVLGAHNISKKEPSQVFIKSSSFRMHSSWDSKTLQNDIAVITLSTAVQFNGNIFVYLSKFI